MQAIDNSMVVNIPSKDESKTAEEAARSLARHQPTKKEKVVSLQFIRGEKNKSPEEVKIPFAAYQLLINLLSEMARGNAVTLMPIHAELTTQEAANLMNVSRPFLIQLLEKGEVPFRKVGSHRRILAKDLFEYKKGIDIKRSETLDELTADAQKLGLDY
ncbi:MAG: excisionase family DNA-binding protein [Bdellovibrionales bacterium]|nr:excisionase family DNA-binding protein [Bdellovibrionales bacterium]